jgi:hypothetical protein
MKLTKEERYEILGQLLGYIDFLSSGGRKSATCLRMQVLVLKLKKSLEEE